MPTIPTPLSPLASPATAKTEAREDARPTDARPTSDPRGGGGSTREAGGGHDDALSSGEGILSLQGFDLSERKLADALGVPVRNLASARTKNLRRGADWELANNDIALTGKSAAALAKALNISLTAVELLEAITKSRRVQLDAPFDTKVGRFAANPRLLIVHWKNAAGQECTAHLMVAKRELYKPGMVVPIRLNAAGKYELARRTPRAKGRW